MVNMGRLRRALLLCAAIAATLIRGARPLLTALAHLARSVRGADTPSLAHPAGSPWGAG